MPVHLPAPSISASMPPPTPLSSFAHGLKPAYLFAVGEYSLHEAVDRLQHDAEAGGLVGEFGQDSVQTILAEAFAARAMT
jgi:hypothetical protein